ncbi:hypothetical protein ABZV31_00960 [Streptomyces sp. NPDC005202]|uniref:hypothetical protein n=1 Tax=Streptomyces sp. NPDC005202 TaxID=3157021 RepID=UPI0033A8981A
MRATVVCFFNFLWQRGKNWDEATSENLLDFEDWRRWSPRNPDRIGGSKWNRELVAMRRLYKWAVGKGYLAASPVVEREVMGRHGQMVSVPAARAKDVRATNVKWLTPARLPDVAGRRSSRLHAGWSPGCVVPGL